MALTDTGNSPQGLWQNRGFCGLLLTQFLGAFNDNLFKELVLLSCIDQAVNGNGESLQGQATLLFAAPFVLFSGLAGFLSDRYSKQAIVWWCKVAELAIACLGLAAFASGNLAWLLVVLTLMGAHSAFFGPSKFGIIPELCRPVDLPRANGAVLLLTFLAIILGFATAGTVKEFVNGPLWLASLASILVAILGITTAAFIRPTPVAEPGLKFEWGNLLIPSSTWRLLIERPLMLRVLLAQSAFWMVGGLVYPPAVNSLGRLQMKIGDFYTGLLAATTGLGIAVGCLAAGWLSRGQVRGRLVRLGAIGIVIALALLGSPGGQLGQTLLGPWGSAGALVLLGLSAGLFTVPLQVYLQQAAPDNQKGRVIGTMNLLNWVGIAASGLIYLLAEKSLSAAGQPPARVFWVAAAIMLAVLVTFRPPTFDLSGRVPE